MSESVNAEHDRLTREVEQLQREHDALKERPQDVSAHQEHRAKLQAKIRELRDHLDRLRLGG